MRPSPRRLSELAAHVGGEIVGNPALLISGLNVLSEASASELSFYGNTRYKRELDKTSAAAVLVSTEVPARDGVTYVRVPNAHLAFAKLIHVFYPPERPSPGIRSGAHVHPEARVHPEAAVLPGATVEKGATVGARSVLYAGAYVGDHAKVGDDCILYPNATVRERCLVGSRVILHASAVIGADGFGFAFNLEGPAGPEHFKIPQVGIVRIEDDVEIGACSCVDRATLGETVIGRGTKIDNLVQVAHNVTIGPLGILCAQVGIAGSTQVGAGVVLAGQVGVVGHVRIGDMAKVGSQSGVAHDVKDGAVMSGSPAIEHSEWLKSVVAVPKLAALMKEVRELKKKVEALERGKPS